MEHPYNWDGFVSGATGDDELDSILNILDFPMESLEAEGLAGDWDASKSHYLGPIPSDDVLMGPSAVAPDKTESQHPAVFPSPFTPPINAAPEPKLPLYQFSDSSGSCVPQPIKCSAVQEQGLFQSQSPVSVLESSASSSAGKVPATLTKPRINKRTRSRRTRPSGPNPWLATLLLISPSSASKRTCKTKGTTRKKPAWLPVAPAEATGCAVELQGPGVVVKKCAHCEVTKTPQWREGPMGPKTLCNACGVRYRSGRLFPEYRPAASPTFVPTQHSNSHKKVLEMRDKVTKGQQHVMEMNGVSSSSSFP